MEPDMLPVAASASTHRYRITFATRATLAYVSVLELGTVWERTLRRAGIALKYSQGFNPRPRMQFAAPLPVGCGGEAEMLDIWLEQPRAADELARALNHGVLPGHLHLVAIEAVSEREPALSEQLIEARYRLWLRDVEQARVTARVAEFLTSDAQMMAKRGRKHRGRSYDLRPLVLDLHLEDNTPAPWIGLHLHVSARHGATGRPDELLKALDLAGVPRRCTRTELILQAADDAQIAMLN